MSGAAPRIVPPTMQTGGTYADQGMISPANMMVNPDGTPTPITFRFLFSMLNSINSLQAQINTINQRLADANIA